MKFLAKLGSWFGTVAKGYPQEWASLIGGGSPADLRKPYANSVWVSRAIKTIANPICAVPLVFVRDQRGGDQVLDDPKLTAFWERPARAPRGMMSLADFIEATVVWMKLKGEAFWVMDDTWLSRRAVKTPLLMARPDEMRHIVVGNELIGWQWTPRNGGKSQALIPDQVVHLSYFNPYDDFRGLAEWEAAKVAADSDYAAGTFAKNLMANNGDRGPYVIGKDGTASSEQIAHITAMLRQKREMSRRGDFRPVFLTGDITVQEPGMQAVDANYVAQRLENRHEIYAAFGVPMSFAEVMASYSIGSASDRFVLIEDTCKPTGSKICDGIEQVNARLLGTGQTVFAQFRWEEHSVMQAVRAERVESATKVVDRGMPWKVASDYFFLNMPRFKGDDVGRVPFSLQEIGEDEKESEPTAPPAAEDPIEELAKLFRGQTASPAPAPRSGCGCGACGTKASGSKEWENVQRKRRPTEKKYERTVRRLLMDARAETLRKLAAQEEGTKQVRAADVLSILFDLGPWLEKWAKSLGGIAQVTMEQAGFELWSEELGRDDPLTMPAADVQTALALRQNRLRNAGQGVWDKVRTDLQAAVDKGASNAELAQAVKGSFKGIADNRAETIATTETTVVYETARDMTFRTAGVQWTQWLHSGLTDHARVTHQAANKQMRPIDEPFDIGGVPMRYPGDPEAPADEVINCKCVRVAAPGTDPNDIEGDNPTIPY